ncbi:protein ABHD18 [Coccinella septempunctata]|uniref:protein ABHD18 n=1 Tax=Coccinella septempunctata TaxID=41139 RepID=UPI001D08D27B|nr:protein ABHD18 [Coccinella septempunctata]
MSNVPISRLDVIYRKILLTKFFSKGWGSPEDLKTLFDFRKVISNRERCFNLVPKNYPIKIINKELRSDYQIIEGSFVSPLHLYMPSLITPEIRTAYFQMILPAKWTLSNFKPVCIHLAGTGDHFFWRRRNIMAKPLLQKGIGAIILENPYYGLRKPTEQTKSSLRYVSDIFIMGGCLVLECITLLNWCVQLGLGPLGVTGISMGGHMASLAASNWPAPIVLVPCLSWSTASTVFTEGVMSESIDWDFLQEEYLADEAYQNILSKICKIVDNPFECSFAPKENAYTLLGVPEKELTYITPHQILKIINDERTSNCPAITYKPSKAFEKFFSRKDKSILNLLKDTSPMSLRSRYISEMRNRDKEALWFMKGIMDECTHLRNFSVPVDTSLIIAICAKADGYIPRHGTSKLEDIWPGVTVKYVDAGHVGAYIWYRQLFINSIVEAFEKAKKLSI